MGPIGPGDPGLAARLRHLMLARGFARSDGKPDVAAVAKALNTTTATVHRWLSSGVAPLKLIGPLCDLLGTTPAWLLYGPGDDRPTSAGGVPVERRAMTDAPREGLGRIAEHLARQVDLLQEIRNELTNVRKAVEEPKRAVHTMGATSPAPRPTVRRR